MVWPNSYFDHRGESINLQLFFVLRRWGVCVFEFITCSMLPTILVMACEFNKKKNKNKKNKNLQLLRKKGIHIRLIFLIFLILIFLKFW